VKELKKKGMNSLCSKNIEMKVPLTVQGKTTNNEMK
jgi:hypothetical protein